MRILSFFNRLFKSGSKEDFASVKSFLLNGFNLKTNNLPIYNQAFTHKSYKRAQNYNNERLELLGDAVLNLILTDFLIHKFPDKKEGELSVLRSHFARRETLNNIAKQINIDKILQYSKFIKFEDASKHNIFGNALEAFIGALFFDKGYRTTNDIVVSIILEPLLKSSNIFDLEMNYKGRLLEYCQQNNISIEFNNTEIHQQKDHFFVAKVIVDGKISGEGTGNKKKTAEQLAAMEAYKSLIIR